MPSVFATTSTIAWSWTLYSVVLFLTNDANAVVNGHKHQAAAAASLEYGEYVTADYDAYDEQEQQLNDLLRAAYSEGYEMGLRSIARKISGAGSAAKVIDGYQGYVTEYFTDVEGHKVFFENIIDNSEVVQWKSDKEKKILEWTPEHRHNGQLIYGGDVMDRGVGQLKILRALVEFKEKNDAAGEPDRVILIIGNRDFNKLRLYKELETEEKFFQNYENFKVHTPKQHADWDKEVAVCENQREKDRSVCRSKLILDKTMGAGKAFEHMKTELDQTGSRRATDEDVLHEYEVLIGMRKRDGDSALIWKYNQMGTFYHYDVIKGILYSHDLPPPTSIGKLKKIDDKAKAMVKTYEKSPGTFDYAKLHRYVYQEQDSKLYSAAGDDFISRILPDKKGRPDEQKQRERFFKAIKKFDAGIQYYVHGHKPMGELPQVVKLKGKRKGGSVYVIDGDTGYGCFNDKEEFRGGLYYNIVFSREAGSTVTKAHIKGQLSKCQNQEKYEFTLPDNKNIGEVRKVDGLGNVLIAFQHAGSEADGQEIWDFSTNFPSWKFAPVETKSVKKEPTDLKDIVRKRMEDSLAKHYRNKKLAKSARVDFFDAY